MINEPTAASLAYGYKTIGNNNKLITVLDFGGGTLDLTLLQFIKNNTNVYLILNFLMEILILVEKILTIF